MSGAAAVAGPDQAVGWLIALACFFINFIMAGLARTTGVLYVALIELYGASREAASSPFSIRVCVRNMSGPLIGLLGQRYGIRAITIIGAVVAALGSILCYFAPNIIWITVFWGVIHGTGFGLSTVLHMMVIGQYFDKYKASALGLGYSGDCFGTFVFPVIMEYLLETYNLRGTFLILGAIVLNVLPMGLLLKKPPWLKRKKTGGNFSKNIVNTTDKDLSLNKTDFKKEENGYGIQNMAFVSSNIDLTNPARHLEKIDSVSITSENSTLDENNTQNNLRISKTMEFIDTSSKSETCSLTRNICPILDVTREDLERHDSLPPLFETEILPPSINSKKCFETQNNDLDNDCKMDIDGTKSQCSVGIKKRRTSSAVSQIAQDLVHRMRSASFASQIAQEGYMIPIQQDQREDTDQIIPNEDNFTQNKPIAIEEPKDLNGHNLNGSNVPNLNYNSNGKQQTKENKTRIMKMDEEKPSGIFQQFLKTNLKPIFILISITMAVYVFLFIGVLTVIIDYAVDNGVSHDDGKFLIIGFSVTDLIGRLSFGQIIDRKLMKMKNYSCITMLLMGILVAALPLNRNFNFMLVCMSLYGLVQGGTAIMFPILIGLYMEKNEESIAMGCFNFYGGLLMLLLAPMIGYFRDQTGSYDWVFHILGIIVALVGLIWQLEPLIIKYQMKQRRRQLNYVIVTKM